MFNLLTNFYEYYFIVLILQGYCVYHSFRRGTHQKWLWIIVFLPLVGSLVYLFSEVIKKRHISNVQATVANVVNPKGRISDLEKQFKFSNTFTNRVALADAYLAAKLYDKAIELYEPALTGAFSNDEHVIQNLIEAYHNVGRFDDIARIGHKLVNNINFSKSRTNLYYAWALEKAGKTELVEAQYKAMNHRFGNYEARYNYGDFLLRQNRKEDAALIFYDIVEEAQHLNRKEKGDSSVWINKSKEEWTRLMG